MSTYVSSPAATARAVTDGHGVHGISDRVSTPIALVDTAPRQARRILNEALAEWGLGHLADSADLIVSELVTNAVVHGQEPASLTLYVDPRADGGLLFVEVEDAGGTTPVPRVADVDDMDGRGLAIVDAVAEDWGCDPAGTGKRVWASLAIGTYLEVE